MIEQIDFHIKELECMKKYPKELFYKGNTQLLEAKKVAIVGSRKPNQYARNMTNILAAKLSKAGVCVVSGGAIGVDAIAHKAAGFTNTIMVAATGLDRRYPAINKNIIQQIEQDGLVLSQFAEGTPSQKYNFVLRNELVVALGDVLVVTYADKNSGTLRSIEYAKKMGKTIYVLPHRIGESEATNELLAKGEAQAIYDIEEFVGMFGTLQHNKEDDAFLAFCAHSPSYEEVLAKFPSRIFEAELRGEIVVKNGKVFKV